MVEQLMFLSLGFLAASFFAILLAPALNQRAERLASRRMRALFPVSLEEMAAERDHLRAEFAVSARAMERRQQQLLDEKAAALSEAGKQLSFVNTLRRQLDETCDALETTEAERADLQTALQDARSALADMTADRDRALAGKDELTARAQRLEQQRDDAKQRMEEQRVVIAELEERIAALEKTGAQARAQIATLANQLEAERASVKTLQETLANHRANATRMGDRIAALEKNRDDILDARREADRLTAGQRALRERLARAQEDNERLRLRLAAAEAAASGQTPRPAGTKGGARNGPVDGAQDSLQHSPGAASAATAPSKAGRGKDAPPPAGAPGEPAADIAVELRALEKELLAQPAPEEAAAASEALRRQVTALADIMLATPAPLQPDRPAAAGRKAPARRSAAKKPPRKVRRPAGG